MVAFQRMARALRARLDVEISVQIRRQILTTVVRAAPVVRHAQTLFLLVAMGCVRLRAQRTLATAT